MNKALSSLVGGALGDALGYSREFDKLAKIRKALPNGDWRATHFFNAPKPHATLDGDGKAYISDDTQMTIATGRALTLAQPGKTRTFAQAYTTALTRAYVTWSQHPDNFRAPGAACMRATTLMAKGHNWLEATDINTMGCGANMRVAPLALSYNLHGTAPIDLAYITAAVTHAHPAALASAGLTVAAILGAYNGMRGGDILGMLLSLCEPDRHSYPHEILGDLWKQSEYKSAAAYLNEGYDICREYLVSARGALADGWAGDTDPCLITGEAWTAPEALAGAVLCVVGLWDTPMQVLQRAAVSNGDSDSLAAIAGNIIGASGVNWSPAWTEYLEAKPLAELRRLAVTL